MHAQRARVFTRTTIIVLSAWQQVAMSCSALHCVAVCCREVFACTPTSADMYTYH